jgi:ribosomal-protein-alanine N-acetyltransferase
MTKPQLRPMTTADLDAILRLELALFGDEAWSRQMLAGELGQQPASRHYVVAEDDGQIVGYAGLLAAGGQADVLTIAVAMTRWGQGLGSMLLAELLAEAVRRRCTEVFLEVRSDNTRAQRLYQWWGFAKIGVRRGYYQPSGTDAIVMRRELSGTDQPRPGGPADRDGTAGEGGQAGTARQPRAAAGSGGEAQ